MLLLLMFRCCITSYCAILMYMHIYKWLTQNKCKLRGLFNTEGSNHRLKWEHTLHEIWYSVSQMDILVFLSSNNHKDALTYTNNTHYQSKAAGTAWLILIISNMLGGCFPPHPPGSHVTAERSGSCKRRERKKERERVKGKRNGNISDKRKYDERKKRWKKWLNYKRKKEEMTEKKL